MVVTEDYGTVKNKVVTYLSYVPRPFALTIYLYTLAVSPSWGVADNTKETTKTMGGFTPFFQQ